MTLIKSAPLSNTADLSFQLRTVAAKFEAMRFTAKKEDIATLAEATEKARELAVQVNAVWEKLPIGPTVYDISAAGYLYGVLHLDTLSVQDASDFIREADAFLAFVTPFEMANAHMSRAA